MLQTIKEFSEGEMAEEEVHGDVLFTRPYLLMVLRRKAAILMERISLLARVSQHCHDAGLKDEGLFHLGRKRILQIKMVFYVRKTMDPKLRVRGGREACTACSVVLSTCGARSERNGQIYQSCVFFLKHGKK